MKRRCSQWLPQHEPADVGWFSISAPSSVSQPNASLATAATRGVTILVTVTPRSEPTCSVVVLGTRKLPTVPSGHAYDAVKGTSPLASLAVRGAPFSSRKSAHEAEAKPSACRISCTAVLSCSGKLPSLASRAEGQKLAWPKMGRSNWSRTHVDA